MKSKITEDLYIKWAEEGTFYGFPLKQIKPATLSDRHLSELKTLVEFYNLSQIDACQRVSPLVKGMIESIRQRELSGDAEVLKSD
jgi:hypothetical protein